MDLSFSNGYINYLSAEEVKDKALSIGEKSELFIEEVNIESSEIGVVSKDSSDLKIMSYTYDDVKLPLTAYIKKEEFGPPRIKIETINPNNKSDLLFSKYSFVMINGISLESDISSKSIENRLYGKEFGAKTIRQ